MCICNYIFFYSKKYSRTNKHDRGKNQKVFQIKESNLILKNLHNLSQKITNITNLKLLMSYNKRTY
jgi:hypothetical protein